MRLADISSLRSIERSRVMDDAEQKTRVGRARWGLTRSRRVRVEHFSDVVSNRATDLVDYSLMTLLGHRW